MTALREKIDSKCARIGIVGLGYVGLPLAVEFARNGFRVTGFDVDDRKVSLLNRGQNYIQDVDDENLSALISEGRLTATADFSQLRDIDCISICVPTPLRKTKDPDLSFIISAVQKIKPFLHSELLIVLESTTYPGTTDELILPELKEEGYGIGEDIFLAFSPERVDPGNPFYQTRNTPKVIGGITPQCTEIAAALYGLIIDTVIPVSSTGTAEMVKLLENTFRAVNIGLVNEMAVMCDKLGINVWEVVEAAATKPFGFMKFYPGPGLGGHCIPIDPHYLSWKLKSLNYNARFIELAGDINSHMPDFVVHKLGQALNQFQKCFNGSKILILGMAYKKDVNDLRESPSLDLYHLLRDFNASVYYHDPYIPEIRDHDLKAASIIIEENIFNPDKYTEHVILPETPVSMSIQNFDAIVVATDHSCYNVQKLIDFIGERGILFDARNLTKGYSRTNIFRL